MEAGQDNSLFKSKPRKDRRQKQDPNAPPAQTAAEAARQMLSKKRFSSKINYDALEKCFSGNTAPSKKTEVSNDDEEDKIGGQSPGDKLESDVIDKENEFGEEDEEGMEEDGHEFDKETAGQEWQFEEEGYDYGYDDDEL